VAMREQADAGSGLPFNKVSNTQRDDLNGDRLSHFTTVLALESLGYLKAIHGCCEAPK
jgi:hypothetical protein